MVEDRKELLLSSEKVLFMLLNKQPNVCRSVQANMPCMNISPLVPSLFL